MWDVVGCCGDIVHPIDARKKCSFTHTGALNAITHPLAQAGAQALLPALAPENTRIQQFEVPDTLPAPLFEALFRGGGGGKKGKKKGKKKKK